MKKITLVIFAIVASVSAGLSQVNNIYVAPTPNTAPGTSGNRGPNGGAGHTVMRAMYNVPASNLTPISTSPIINSFGFALTNTLQTGPASGTLTVYLQNTSSSTYTNGTTWTTAGMTQVYTGTYTIPTGTVATNVDFPFPSNFAYTGGALNVAYEYTAAVTAGGVAIYQCFVDAAASGATGAAATVVAPTLATTAFRPLFRFGTPNTYTNEISVEHLASPGKFPQTFASPVVVMADIRNNSNITKTNFPVTMTVSGVTNYTNTQFIGSLAPGAVTTVTFGSYPSGTQGTNTVSVGLGADENNANNLIVKTQSITCDVWSYNVPGATGSYTSGVGFGAGTGIISSQFQTPVASTLISVRIAISTDANNTSKPAYGVLLNSTGAVIAQTNTLTISPGMLGTFQNFVFTAPQALTSGTTYYTGYAQQAVTGATYYPIGTQTPAINPNNYFTHPLAGGAVNALTTNFGYFGIEPMFTSTCSSVGVKLNELVANTISVYPNPVVNGKATVSGLEGTNTITVYNMLGQVVLTLTSDREEVSIDLVAQPIGNYLVKITDSNKATKTVKIINQ